ncbi:MAG: DUF1800 family protein [Burkholderiales bacterium]|nr:DUF1800 family protein [Burkholderiales bacterium]
MSRYARIRAVTIGVCLLLLFVALPASALSLTGAQSRKVHGTAGTYDLALDRAASVTGAVTVESRIPVNGHLIVFQFDAPITAISSVSLTDVGGTPFGNPTAQFSGNDVIVTLTNIADNRRVKISLAGVNGSLATSVSIGFLAGDINNSFSVNASDITGIKARSGQTVSVSANNFKYDINVSGAINSSDISAVKARSGVTLGTTPAPTVALSNVAMAQVSTAAALTANASIGAGGVIARVEFYEGATKIGEVVTAPYTLNWTPGVEGPTTLVAKAVDTNGAFNFSALISVTVAPHPKADAARLLTQATFGATVTEISRVALMTPAAYLEEQFNTAQTSHLTTVRNDPLYPTTPYAVAMPSIWKQYFEAEDQLRQRVVFAISQIMVISMNNNTIGDQACASASYLDLLGANAFGNFRNLLKDITLSPAMGEYLDMKGSAKADAALNSIPSENYAREMMQLFSIGTVMLNIDGSLQLDAMGKPINTYSEAIAQEVARALTGWNHAGQNQADPYKWLYPDVPFPTEPVSAAKACTGWSAPMEPWLTSYRSADGKRTITGGAHDTGVKTLLTYPGATSFSQSLPAGQTPMQDLDGVINNVFNHPNVGPFIGEQLIMRLVTSNPSSAYVTRVASAFNNNGAGVRGDMKAVIRAILLDPEARAPRGSQPNTFGKLREPVLRFAHMHRAFEARMAGGYYASIYDLGSSDSLGQSPMHAGSVFNFYHPDYTPSGPLSRAQLYGPEFEISNSATISGFMDFSKYGIVGGFNQSSSDPNTRLAPNYAGYIAVAHMPAVMIDAMSLTLMSAGISAEFRTQLIDIATRLTDANAATQATERFKTALWLILNSPEYSIQK